MRRIAVSLALALLAAVALAADERIETARRLSEARDPAAAAAWERVIEELSDDPVVTIGDAHWFAAEAYRVRDDADAAIRVMTAFLKQHRDSPGEFRARRGLFLDFVAAGRDADAQKAGASLLGDHPDANGCYDVLATFLDAGWRPPKLRTSFAALRAWTYERTDGSSDADLRIAFIELLERMYPKEAGVKDGATLYTKGWAHQQAGRHDEAIALFKRYLAKDRDGDYGQRVRLFLAESLLALDPPDETAARRQLEKAAEGGGKQGERAQRLVDRHREPLATPRTAVIALTSAGAEQLRALDAILHFGHGTPWGVNDGLQGEEVGILPLSHAPVVVSGACFNGVCGRNYHPSQMQPIHLRPATVAPDRLMTLNWVHAGVSGYLAALEADRGEMAMAEWSRLQQTAEPLGAVIGHQYRTVFTSLPAAFTSFRRYRNRVVKDMSFYRVMLRGAVSRLLVGDPSLRPFAAPLDEPAQEQAWTPAGDGAATLTARVLRFDQGTSQNYLPTSGKDAFGQRLYVRAEFPEGQDDALGAPSFRVATGDTEIPTDAIRMYDEVWGGRRYVNVVIESTDRRLASAGATLTCTFAPAR